MFNLQRSGWVSKPPEMASWAKTNKGSAFNSIHDHMAARQAALLANVEVIRTFLAEAKVEYAKNGFTVAGEEKFNLDLKVEMEKPIGRGVHKQAFKKNGQPKGKAEDRLVDCRAATFSICYDPRNNTVYEITGFPEDADKYRGAACFQ